MNQMNTQISVRAAQGRYQALNDLERPEMRDRAAEFLGLELIPAA